MQGRPSGRPATVERLLPGGRGASMNCKDCQTAGDRRRHCGDLLVVGTRRHRAQLPSVDDAHEVVLPPDGPLRSSSFPPRRNDRTPWAVSGRKGRNNQRQERLRSSGPPPCRPASPMFTICSTSSMCDRHGLRSPYARTSGFAAVHERGVGPGLAFCVGTVTRSVPPHEPSRAAPPGPPPTVHPACATHRRCILATNGSQGECVPLTAGGGDATCTRPPRNSWRC